MFFLWIVHDSSSHVPNWYTREQGDSNLQPTCHTFLVLSAHKPHLARPSSYMIVAPYDRCLFSSNRALLVVFPCYHDASISRHLCWWCVVLRRRTHQCNKQDHTTMACLRIMLTKDDKQDLDFVVLSELRSANQFNADGFIPCHAT